MQYIGHSQQHAPVKLLKAFQVSGTQVCTKADHQGISDSPLSICQSLLRGVLKRLAEGRNNKMNYWPLQESKQQKGLPWECTHFFGCAWKEKKGRLQNPE